ncbi:MAG: hypothetical protein LCH92_08325 [Proteobacteria bacterium]|nr:hypothetical protein [Pseudomonadota bacterium]
MNAATEIEQGTALALPAATDLAALFKREDGIAGIVAQLEIAARDEAKGYDASTKKGREALKSLAAKVSTSKAELDRQGKALTEQQRKEIDAVNAGRRVADQRLAALRDEIRKPVTDWEKAEEDRIEALKARLARMEGAQPSEDTSEAIRALIQRVEAVELDDSWAEYKAHAAVAKDAKLTDLRRRLAATEKREAEQAELARLRAEQAKRDEEDRLRREAEEAEARRIEAEKAEAERLAQIERDKAEAAERARREAEEKAKAEADRASREAATREAQLLREREAAKRVAEEAEARRVRELAEAEERTKAAAQAERDRIAAERAAEEEARRKREADHEHRAQIRAEIIEALSAMRGAASPQQIADALMAGKIPHCEVKL